MRIRLSGGASLFALCLLSCSPGRPPPVDVSDIEVDPRLVAAGNQFGFDLYREVRARSEEANLMLSPLSVAMVLAMAAEGAEGATLAEIEAALGLSAVARVEWGPRFSDLKKVLEHADPRVEVSVANSVWVEERFALRPEFAARCRDPWGGEVRALDFADPAAPASINGWVEEATHGRIDRIVESLAPENLVHLLNAVYFQGTWEEPFEERHTESAPFTRADGSAVDVPLMRQHETFPYFETETFQAIGLPYGNRRFEMRIFLPRPGVGLPGFHEELGPAAWEEWDEGFTHQPGTIALPRFTARTDVDLTPGLAAQGLATAFGLEADFSGIGDGPLFLSGARHKTLLEVNEEGTVAVAVTDMLMVGAAAVDPFEMVVDRPFFAAIVDAKSGAILFLGSIGDPSHS